jgi:PAT family beta-lactamase induction signal transducer AmpG
MSDSPIATPDKRPSTLAAAGAYLKPKPLLLLALGFTTGVPFLLIGETLTAWLRVDGLSLSVIGFFILVGFSYSLKFMWAPLIDRLDLPFLTAKLGHRRSWMAVLQVIILLCLLGVATTDPRTSLATLAAFATLAGFFGATHDIILDAYRIEAADNEQELVVMTAAYQWGYRIAFILTGILPLMLSTRIGWPLAYGLTATMMVIGWIALVFAPRGPAHTPRPIHYEGLKVRPILEGIEWLARALVIVLAAVIMGSGLTGNADLLNGIFGHFGVSAEAQAAFKTAWTSKTTGPFFQVPAVIIGLIVMLTACLPLPWATRPGAYFKGAFIAPLADFFQRYAKWAAFIFILVCLYRVSEFTLYIANAYYIDLGFSLDAVAEMRKVFGAVMTMIGFVISGWLMVRIGIRQALIVGAIVGPFSHVGFMILACTGHDLHMLGLALALDNIAASIQGTVLIAYMSTLVSPQYTAPQYALFSSIYGILGKLVGSQSGRIVEATAKSADAGGFGSSFKSLMNHLTPDAYVTAAQKLGVSIPAMGAGYFAFFAYTIVVGFVAIGLTLWLYFRRPPELDAPKSAPTMNG